MAEAALSMSLDDLIKSSKTKKQAANKGSKGGKSGGKGKPSGLGVKGAGVKKGGNPKSGIKVGGGRGRPSQAPPRRDPDATWVHDMYSEGPRRGGRGRGGNAPSGRASDFTLYISNLDFSVTNDDVQELFTDFPSIKRCFVNYDRSGRSTGKATVVFGSRDEAVRAKKRYTNMALDGKIMELELVDGAPARGGGPTKLSSGITLSKPGAGGRAASVGGGGAGRAFSKAFRSAEMDHAPQSGRGRRRGRNPPRGRGGSGAGRDLDSELDDYMQE